MTIEQMLTNKRVLFVTTKNIDYIRNTQELRLIKQCAAVVQVIGTDGSGYAKRLCKVYRRLLTVKAHNYDVVFIGFAPQLILPVLHRKFKKNQVVIDFYISLYDTFACDRQIVRQDSLAAKLLRRIDSRTLQLADRIITDTRAHGEFFVSEFGAAPNKLEVLYLEADREIYYPRKKERTTREEGATVLYFGSILPLQGVETVIAAAKLLKDNGGIHFVVIGPVKKSMKWCEGGG